MNVSCMYCNKFLREEQTTHGKTDFNFLWSSARHAMLYGIRRYVQFQKSPRTIYDYDRS
jgi:hypothetical protein